MKTFSITTSALYLLICLIWGSSFILMKLGLYSSQGTALLSPYHVAALRVVSAGAVLLPFVFKELKYFPIKRFGYVLLSGLLGIFFPAFLFCIAETHMNSALAGSINALTPIFAILAGLFIYKTPIPLLQRWGILIGLTGTFLLFTLGHHGDPKGIYYGLLIVVATIFYGINANIVKQNLGGLSSVTIAAFSFGLLIVPSLIILGWTGFFSLPLTSKPYVIGILASCVLGVMGSALAWILFYNLIKKSGAVFASSVTYVIPFVALMWGWVYGESIVLSQVICLAIILGGVYLANVKARKAVESA